MPSATKRKAMERERRRRQSRTLAIAAGAVLLVAVIAVLASSLGGNESVETGVTQSRSVVANGDALPTLEGEADPAIGMAAPSLTGQSFDGSPVSISPGDGPTAIWFLAHWCPHCQAEVPRIVTLAEQGALPDDVTVVGVSTGVDATAPNYPPSTWLEEEGWPFPVLADDEAGSAASAYGLNGFPFLVLIDADGRVSARYSGELGDQAIVAALGG